PPSESTTVTSPPTTSSSSSSTQSSSVTTVPGSSTSVPSDKGTVVVDAKVMTRSGGTQAVKNETFYLLDKDLAEILDDANIEDESGQGLQNTFGLSVLFPSRYPEIRQKALAAISRHTKYKGLTDSSGKAM